MTDLEFYQWKKITFAFIVKIIYIIYDYVFLNIVPTTYVQFDVRMRIFR